jgi:hypothetical protein
MDNNRQEDQLDPAALCFEEYKDCFGDPGELMKRHLLCNLCGGHLHFNHMADFKHQLIQETARCPDCGIRVRQRLHKLQ